MKSILVLLLLFPALISFSQELPRAVKKVNPSLFVNNMENERVYQQANIRENLVLFSRSFEGRPIEEVQESFQYRFLDEKNKNWLLELKLDRHEIKVSGDGYGLDPVDCSDFGFKVYEKRNEVWKDVTLEVIPENFLIEVTKNLPELQKGSRGMYFYNQIPERGVQVDFDKNKLMFKQNGETVLTILWKNDSFIWKK